MADATKAMQQLHGLDIGGTAISVKIAAIAATDMAGLAGLNLPTLDDDEGEFATTHCILAPLACTHASHSMQQHQQQIISRSFNAAIAFSC